MTNCGQNRGTRTRFTLWTETASNCETVNPLDVRQRRAGAHERREAGGWSPELLAAPCPGAGAHPRCGAGRGHHSQVGEQAGDCLHGDERPKAHSREGWRGCGQKSWDMQEFPTGCPARSWSGHWSGHESLVGFLTPTGREGCLLPPGKAGTPGFQAHGQSPWGAVA